MKIANCINRVVSGIAACAALYSMAVYDLSTLRYVLALVVVMFSGFYAITGKG